MCFLQSAFCQVHCNAYPIRTASQLPSSVRTLPSGTGLHAIDMMSSVGACLCLPPHAKDTERPIPRRVLESQGCRPLRTAYWASFACAKPHHCRGQHPYFPSSVLGLQVRTGTLIYVGRIAKTRASSQLVSTLGCRYDIELMSGGQNCVAGSCSWARVFRSYVM